MQRGNIQILIIVILAAIVGYFVYTNYINKQAAAPSGQTIQTPFPTADPMANWKTYTNNQFKFLIRYPENFSIELPSGEIPWSLQITGPDFGLPIFVYKARAGESAISLAEQGVNSYVGSKPENKQYSVDTVVGQMVIGDEQTTVYIINNGNRYQFITTYKANNKEATLKTFDQILPTFKFTQ